VVLRPLIAASLPVIEAAQIRLIAHKHIARCSTTPEFTLRRRTRAKRVVGRRATMQRVVLRCANCATAHDALGAHARDELGISKTLSARPLQAALASACSFAAGAALPLLVVAFGPEANLISIVSGASLLFLGFLGGLAAYVGDANVARGVMRVTFWSALAIGVTAGIGALFGTVLAT
jgi:hypothetical protein